MKTRKMMSLLALALALTLPLMSMAEESFGAANVQEGKTYTLEEMLTWAIEDEYLAQAEYKAIMAAFGEARPFTNIMKAEGVHVEHLLPLFAAHGVAVPADTAAGHVVMPATLEEAYQTGVTAEVHNIAMYEAFLSQGDLPEDVETVFKALKKASESHFDAFQRNVDKPGDGQASRGGNRWTDEGGFVPGQGRGRGRNGAQDGNNAQPQEGRGRRGN